MNNSEPILFSCPSCGAKYKIVTIDSPGSWYHGKVACSKCNALFPAGDESLLFKYMVIRHVWIYHERYEPKRHVARHEPEVMYANGRSKPRLAR